MEAFIQTLRNLGPMRLTVMGLVGFALIGFLVYAVSRLSTPPLELLYKDLDMQDSSRIVAQLEKMGEPHDIRDNGGSVWVSKDKVLRLRMTMADQGIPSGGSIGYELFDNANTLGSTNFVQNINLVRALEGELSRTIRALDAVQTARVHLVLPRRELFSRETQQPSASIILKLNRGARLSREQVASIQHLVAAAVPQLVPNHVSVIDERGTLLARGFEEEGSAGATAMKNEERRLAMQRRLTETVENLVAQAVGFGKVRAEVNVEVDFDRVSTQEEIYNPEGQVVRSTQTVESGARTRETDGTPPVTVGNNLPDPNSGLAGGAGSSSDENRTEETVNYEISKRVVNHVREGGAVKRLSVALLVDGTYATDANGAQTYQPRGAEELEKIGVLARNAVGLNADRGDTLEVINMRFVDAAGAEEKPLELFLGFNKADLLHLAELLVLAIVVILVVFLIGRPLINRFLEVQSAPAGVPEGRLLTDRGSGAPALAGPAPVPVDGIMEEEESFEELIDIDRVEGRVKASSVKKVGEIVEKHPQEALSILRTWMYQES